MEPNEATKHERHPSDLPADWQSIEEWNDRVAITREGGGGYDELVLQNNLLFEIAMQLAAMRAALEQIASWRG